MKEALPYLTLFVAACALLYSIFKDRRAGVEAKFQQLSEVIIDVAVLKATWRFLEAKVLEVLHHPHRHELDALLDAHRERTLSPEQRDRLLTVLDDIKADPNEGWAATMLMVSLQAQVTAEAMRAQQSHKSWWSRMWER